MATQLFLGPLKIMMARPSMAGTGYKIGLAGKKRPGANDH
jgi:hypothetical protein